MSNQPTLMQSPTVIPTEEFYSADYDTYLDWESWYLGLRTALHNAVLEELASEGPLSALDEFFDVYGLALERAYGFPSLLGFVEVEPPRSQVHPAEMNVSVLRGRIDAALSGAPINYGAEMLPEVARLLRARAKDLCALAERIEQGSFEFPVEPQ